MNNIDNLTYKEMKEIANLFGNQTKSDSKNPFEIGKKYFIRTVTMHLVGKLEAVFDTELVISGASWIADSGRFFDALKDGEKAINEVEPFLKDVIIGRGSLIDMTEWSHELLNKQK